MNIHEISQFATLQREMHDAVEAGEKMSKEVFESAAPDEEKYKQLLYEYATTLGQLDCLVDAMGVMIDNAAVPKRQRRKRWPIG